MNHTMHYNCPGSYTCIRCLGWGASGVGETPRYVLNWHVDPPVEEFECRGEDYFEEDGGRPPFAETLMWDQERRIEGRAYLAQRGLT